MIYGWANDLRENTGEGALGLTFIKEISCTNTNIFLIRTNKNIFYFKNGKKIKEIKKKEIFKYNTFLEKYFSNIIGICFLIKKNKEKNKIIYINYLPFWNWLIFLLLPKKTVLGPITGGSSIQEVNFLKILIRKKIFPLFFKISSKIIKIKFPKAIFSTSLLKKYVQVKNNYFDFSILYLKYIIFKKKKKNINLIYYNRKNSNKNNPKIKELIIALSKEINIHVFGDILDGKKFINHGYISNTKKNLLLSRSKYAIISSENLLSLFTLECLKNNIKIFFDSNNQLSKYSFDKKSFIKLNLMSLKKCKNYIIQIINDKYKFTNSEINNILNSEIKKWNLYKLNFFK
jgi:hypothetical protein